MSQIQISCKLTNSLFSYIDRQGTSLQALLENIDEPEEFLRNPYYWIPVERAERYFERAARALNDPMIADTVGRRVHELESWGALDSVLRMMTKPEEFYSNLAKFFSYFVANYKYEETFRSHDSVRFVFPFSRQIYPHCFDFMRAALESLPLFSGHNPARADWIQSTGEMAVAWHLGQASLFDLSEDPGKMLNPRIVQNLVAALEKSERMLEERTRELVYKNQEIQKLKMERAQQLRERVFAEKMSGIAQLAAGVAHEINNPLAYVESNLRRLGDYLIAFQTYIDALELNTGPIVEKRKALDIEFLFNEIPQMIRESLDGMGRVKAIVKDLSSLAHPRAGQSEDKTPADLNNLLESSLKVLSENIGDRIRIERDYHLEQPVKVYPVRMGQVFMNLINNAVQAIPQKGTIKVATKSDAKKAYIEIMDTGVGMDEDVLAQLFTPFFTTKEVGKGTGLGLAIAQSIVEMHKGQIEVESQKGQGTCVTVQLPLEVELEGGSLA